MKRRRFISAVATVFMLQSVAVVQHAHAIALADLSSAEAAELGLMKKEDANIQKYVNDKTRDGLFFMVCEEEKWIRFNPVAYGSAILPKVFGALL